MHNCSGSPWPRDVGIWWGCPGKDSCVLAPVFSSSLGSSSQLLCEGDYGGWGYLWCDQVKPLLYTAFLATFAFRQPRPLRPAQNWSRKTFPSGEEAQAARHELSCTFHLLSGHSCYPSWALNPAACVWHCTWSCHSLHSPSLRTFIASGAISRIYYTSVTLESWLISQVMVLPLHLYFGFFKPSCYSFCTIFVLMSSLRIGNNKTCLEREREKWRDSEWSKPSTQLLRLAFSIWCVLPKEVWFLWCMSQNCVFLGGFYVSGSSQIPWE